MEFSSLWTDTGSSLEKVIWALFIGISLAAILLWYQKGYIGRLSRYLYSKEIDDKEKALTAKEMDFKGFFFRRELSNKYSALRKVVYCTNDAEKIKKNEFDEARFYLPKETRDRAYFKYRGRNTTIAVVISGIFVMFIAANLCIKYIPSVIDTIKNMV